MLSRRHFLGSTAAALGAGLLAPRARAAGDDLPTHLIVVTAIGGWDVSYGLDPKPGSPRVDGPEVDEVVADAEDREQIGTYGELTVARNDGRRPAVDAFFQAWADRCVLVRGLWVGSISHDACRVRMLTGTQSEDRPDWAAMAADALGRDAPIPYMDLGGNAFAGELAAITGRSGRTNQLRTLLDRRAPLPGPTGSGTSYPLYAPQPATRADIDAWLAGRVDTFTRTWSGRPGAEARLADLAIARGRAAQLREEGPTFADRLAGGDARTLASQADLAVELLESGLSHTVLVDSGELWDSHDANIDQHGLHQRLFKGLDRLVQGLDDAGLLDRTVVAVLSEMSRTPRRNSAGGKDHWPVTSALLLGGPLRGGRVLGGTDEGLDALPVDLRTGVPSPSGTVLRYDHLAAGVLGALGARPDEWFGGVPALGGLTS